MSTTTAKLVMNFTAANGDSVKFSYRHADNSATYT